ncbi:fatty acid synthase-like isoform X1 [Temnothorax longispinosus]|uniref:fatty acid synthase-like isoform X1 n=2 Tax=Temnothorax longispinosus TaxID=300112 RepID=UPI003A99588C
MNRPNLYISVDAEEEIVISGIAGRFPNSDNLKEFQENLFNKADLGSSDHGRWNNSYNIPHQIGKVNNIEKFDSEFFNIPTTEAHIMDPMTRMLLEHTYEAIIDAGVNPKELRGTKTSVLTAISQSETRAYFSFKSSELARLPMTGCNVSFVANTISYWLGITGQSHNIDTACSSSISAIVKAYEQIRSGNCDAAIIASASLCLSPFVQMQFCNLGVLSSDGYCKPFDEEGAGYMRGETIAVVYLQKAKNARRIYATIVHGKINCDGFKEEGITFPSVEKQKILLDEFYKECEISPNELSYMEAHATGTLVGDPIEVTSIDQTLCAKRNTPLLMGSVKSNIGHSEPASGLCQIAKVLLAMETGIITPTIHFKRPRKELTAIIEGRIKIVTEPTEWEGGYVGINAFGFGGANSHILLKSNPKQKINNAALNDDLPRLVAVSGRTEEAVKIILDDVRNRPIDTEFISLLHHIHNDDIESHPYRGYMITGSKISHNIINKIKHTAYIKRPICFIFSGLGSEWFGMSRALIKFPVFAKAIQKCDTILKPYGILLTNILTSDNKNIFDNIINFLLSLIGLQIGLVDLLTSIGVVPDFIIGHSIGELICGYADGCLTAEETILSAYFIGLALHGSKIINGSMAEINLDLETLKVMCPSDIDIACYNTSSNFIVSGPTNSIKTFLTKLQANSISIKEISCGYIPFHSRYIKPAVAKSEEYLNRTLPQKKFYSSKWLTTSSHEYSNTIPLCSKHYTNYLMSPVLFAKTIRSVPKDTVTIEISPQNILQHILNNYLYSTVTNVALYERTEDHNNEIFLESIGKLYNAGLQPQIANLYPTVEFPVSRGTPIISPLIRWDHSENFLVVQFCPKKIIDKRETVVSIITTAEEFAYFTGHVVNEKNLFPAMGYLFYIWEMIALLKNQEYINTSVVFEDVNFIRATVLSQQNEIELTLSIQEGSNRFEIIEGNNAIVTGTVRIPTNIENEKISANLAECIDDEEEMNTKDIYKELRLRGYQYAGAFRGLKSASVTGSNGHIAWTSNWVAFMDSMLQMMILGQNLRSLYVPTRIRKLTIDPKYHTQIVQDYPIEDRQFSVRRYKSLDAIISGGIEICGTVATPISRRQKVVNTVLEEYKFVAHRDLGTMSLQDTIRMSMHIALECCNMINVKIIEFVDDSDKVAPEDLNYPLVSEILNDLPQIRHYTKLVTTHEKFPNISLPENVSRTETTKLSKDENCLIILGFDILTKNSKKLYKQLLSLLMPQGFLMTLEKSGAVYDYSCLKMYELDIILEKQINDKKLLLLRKMQNIARNQRIVHVNNYEFSWVDELKSIMNVQNETGIDTEIILVSEEDFECGLLGFINCLRKEPGGEIIKSVFIQDDKAPTFSLQEPLYTKQLQLDLPINVIRSGNVWGSYRHLPLPSLESKLVQRAYVTQMVQGDMSTLCWAQSRISRINHENVVNVIYTSINFRDIMVATGRLNAETIAPFERGNDCFIGLEFVGFDTHKQRIMGLCSHGGMTNILVADKYLSWIIPDKWTMEDAATIPCVYSTCYYALYMRGKMKKGDKILIHSGTGGIGQAAIHLALHEGCEVFTTVGTVEKRQFIRETFPSIPEDNIGNSRDTSFEQMIMQRTKGCGVDIVLNSLAEEKLQASVRCLANGGRFLEIGKFDMFSNNSLDISIFSKNISFYGILLDKLFYSNAEQKSRLWKTITEGLKDGAIKPLCRRVFERNEIEAAFRYMAAGKHIGKIIIRVHKEEEPLNAPLLAHPRYYCLEHKCYVILGGLGGFGLELADWLTLRGAKNLVLTSRTGIRTGYQQSRVKLWRSYGVDVQIVTVDDNLKHEDCESLLKFAEERAPVDAIFNLAVVLKDCIFQNQSPKTFEDSFKSKAWMTKKMDELSRKICLQLRHFVVFSSVSCGRGNAGQTNYGMANSVMERICEKRMEKGLHGLAIQWGAVGDVGLVADMQEENKELVIGGTLQQRISSCLKTLELFLLQDRPVVSSMVVAEKAKIGGSMNIYEIVAHIMGLKNISTVPPNVPLVEIGMDSMMAVEIKQTLEREFDISLTAQDIKTLNFAKLRQMTITTEQGKIHDTNKIEPSNLEGFDMLIQKMKDADFVPDILVEFITKKEVDRGNIFLLPGIEGCSNVYETMASGIKSSATCLQHGVLNIPDESHSVMKSAAHLLPHVLKKMKDQRKFLIVGYSFGSLIAIELARLLEAKDFSGRLILIDGAPDQLKFWTNQYLNCTSPDELQNVILLRLLEMYSIINQKKLALELNKCNTVDEKLKVFHAYFPKDLNVLTIENQKLIYFTVYNHIVAVQDYDISSLPRLKSPITLLKPTSPIASFTEEDYSLHKVTEGKVQIHYVEGNHITMMDNEKITSAINETWIEDNKIEDNL